MSRPDKFLFDTDFDADPPLPETEAIDEQSTDGEGEPPAMEGPGDATAQPEPSAPARFDDAAVAAAREEAFEEGRRAGLAEAGEADARVIAAALARLPEALAAAAQAHAARADDVCSEILQIAVGIVRKLFPRLAERHGLDEIEAVLEDCLKRLPGEPRIVVRIHDANLDALKELVDPIVESATYDGKLVLIADEDLEPGDVRVEWADGGSDRDTARLWRDIDSVLDRYDARQREETPNKRPTAAQDKVVESRPRATRQPQLAATSGAGAVTRSNSAPGPSSLREEAAPPAAVHERDAIGA